MKISGNTIKILQNFANINQGIVIRPGNTLRTMAEERNLFAQAEIEETFDKEFGVYDLKKLLAILSMQKNPDLTVSDAVLTIRGDKSAISVRHTNTKLIKSPPDKNVVTDYLVSFPMTLSDIKWIFDTSSILGTRHVVFKGKNGRLSVDACDVEGKVVDEGSLDLGETQHTFKAVLFVDRLKIMSGDYDVSISKHGIIQFKLKTAKLTYWVALLQEPSEFTTT